QADAAQSQRQAALLQQELSELQAKQTDRGTLVTLGDVLFEFGRAEVRPTASGAIGKLAKYLNDHADRSVLIEGFTDSVGGDAANMALSQRRAQSVADALRAQGVDPTRVATRGYGEQHPVASNANTSDRAMNRRVEVYISN
ncbi:flagellar motor protein MotB, partial [Pelomonas sp. HMWF004]